MSYITARVWPRITDTVKKGHTRAHLVTMDQFRNYAYFYVCRNGGKVALSVICDRYGSIRGTSKTMKQILEEDEQSRFTISSKGGMVKCSVRTKSDANRVDKNALVITNLDDYLDRVYCHLSENNLPMTISDVAEKFGSARKWSSSNLKKILETDAKARFIVDNIGGGNVRARLDCDGVGKTALAMATNHKIEESKPKSAEVPVIGKMFQIADKTK